MSRSSSWALGIEEIEGVVLEGGVDAGFADEGAAAFGEGGGADGLGVVERREFGLKFAFEAAFDAGGEVALGEREAEHGDPGDDEHHRHEELRAKARGAGRRRRGRRGGGGARGGHGKSTRSVAPSVSSTACSRVVLLSTQAMRV